MAHGTELPEGLSPEALATRLGDLRYDALAAVLHALGSKLDRDAEADLKRGRPKLAESLSGTATSLHQAAHKMDRVWGLCAPHMRNPA